VAETIHGTAVLAGADGVLVRGASGAGKSSLAAAMIERGARLIADDRVHVAARSGRLLASAPAATAGQMEMRGRGVVSVPHEQSAVVRLVVDIVGEGEFERMPEASAMSTEICGITLPRQAVTGDLQKAVMLVCTALEALSSHRNITLRPERLWG
jgi:serine kinase of HPr protein (carbohydrate metabolism regulator)